MPSGRVLEPCRGGGASAKALPDCGWCDLAAGRDFLAAKGRWDWIVSNPPYSQFRAFLQKAMQVADNIVFVGLAPAWFVRARQEDMQKAGFALVELCALPAEVAPVRHRADRRMGPPRLAGEHRPHEVTGPRHVTRHR